MPCSVIRLPGGGTAIIKHSKRPTKPCAVCARGRGEKLCDFPLTGGKAGKTCNRPLCDRCATHVEPDTDYCPTHARMVGAEGGGR